jgi:hypothetical protein
MRTCLYFERKGLQITDNRFSSHLKNLKYNFSALGKWAAHLAPHLERATGGRFQFARWRCLACDRVSGTAALVLR